MHLKTGVVAIIIAAAAGAAAGRATSPRVSNGSSPSMTAVASPASAFGSSGAFSGEATGGATDRFASEERTARAASRASSGRGGGSAPPAQAVVYVTGAVAKPGIYTLHASDRAGDAVRAAGGATVNADLVAINLAARVEDGEEIAVPLRGAGGGDAGTFRTPTKHSRRHSTGRGHRRKRRGPSAETSDTADVPTETVDVNEADEATLETLPGIGASLAERIVAFRNLNGPFASSDELLDVGGMTAGKVDALSPYVTFH